MDANSVPIVKEDVGEATVEVCGVVPNKKDVEVSFAGSIGQIIVLPTVDEGSFSFPDGRESGASGKVAFVASSSSFELSSIHSYQIEAEKEVSSPKTKCWKRLAMRCPVVLAR
ncbi:hypothetical protein ACOSQ2_027244 [Xanthoceras sorbifolium]